MGKKGRGQHSQGSKGHSCYAWKQGRNVGKNWQGMQGKYFIQLLECKGWEVNAVNVIHCKGVYITGRNIPSTQLL